MNPERWQRIEATLHAALAVEGSEQAKFLQAACGDDAELLRDVTALLEADRRASGFLEDKAVDQLPDWQTILESAAGSTHVPSYHLLRELGHGGMSIVYLATRTGQDYEHQVAIKVIKRGLDSDSWVRRFRSERQILASLRHPNIASFLDGGTTTDDGRPYFVMEYIEGVQIHEYCDRQQHSVAQRLDLICQVCSAVQYAHQNLIVHCDIKPGNILVTPEGVPKLLDFGIAKLLAPQEFSHAAEATLTGPRPLTPGYASPEQLAGRRVTTASDVYSLGVLLHKLFTGRLPREPAAESAGRSDDSVRNGSSRPLSGDLEKIVHMALREEPERRYASAEQLSEDLRRYLRGLPVRAQRDTWTYRARRFLGRHTFAVGASMAFLVLVMGFGVAMVWQANKTQREYERAEFERTKAEQVSALLFDLFENFDPSVTGGDTVTAQELLDRGAERVEQQLEGQNLLQAAAFDVIGKAYHSLAIYDRAEKLYAKSLELRRGALGHENREAAASLTRLGALFEDTGDFDRSETLHREALSIRRELLGEHPEVAESQSHLAITLWHLGRYREAEPLQRQALALQRRLLDENDPAIATSLSHLANLRVEQGDLRGAVEITREALAIERQQARQNHTVVATLMSNLAIGLAQQGRYEDAETLHLETLALRRKALGEEHPQVARSMHALGGMLIDTGEHERAERYLRSALEIRRQRLQGEPNVALASNLSLLASLLWAKGDLEGAVELYHEALELGRQAVPPGHPGLAYPLLDVGRVLLEMGKAVEAEAFLREAYDIRQRVLPETSPQNAETASALGTCLVAQRRYGEAEGYLLEGYRNLTAQPEPEAARVDVLRRTLEQLVSLYESWDRPTQAGEYRGLLSGLQES